jgi:hypothetical protein
MQTWTATEEKAFAQLMEAGRLERVPAIRVYRRYKGNMTRAMGLATAEAPTDDELVRRKAFGDAARLRAAQKRAAA